MPHPEVPDGTPKPENPDGVTWTRRDLQVARKAIALSGNAIPDELRNESLYQITAILALPDTKSNRRLKLACVRTLAVLDRVDLSREKASRNRPPAGDAPKRIIIPGLDD